MAFVLTTEKKPPRADLRPEEGIYNNMANGGEPKFDPDAKTNGAQLIEKESLLPGRS
jgi:hypothetical protein